MLPKGLISMVTSVGRNRNITDVADVKDGIVVNSTTSTVIAVANPRRLGFHVNNNAAVKACWVKEEPASANNTKKGRYLAASNKGKNYWDMKEGEVYTGEISAMADSGSETLYVTEYS